MWNKLLAVACSILLLLGSCRNPQTEKAPVTQADTALPEKPDMTQLNDLLKKYEEPGQIFTIPANKPTLITGRKGTLISVNPHDLVTESGKPLSKNIEVALKELHNQGELLRANAQTVSDGKILVSGGAYFIGMRSGGERLKLKTGKKLKVQFPRISDKEMTLFYGHRNELGQMNWIKTTETFKRSLQPETAKDTAITRGKSGVESILEYVEGTSDSAAPRALTDRAYNSIEVYGELYLDQLDWINCDRFLEVADKTTLSVAFNPQDSVADANVFIVFKDINSVMQDYAYDGKPVQFNNMPAGYKVRVIAYTEKGAKIYAYAADLVLTKGQELTPDLKEVDSKEFKKLMGK